MEATGDRIDQLTSRLADIKNKSEVAEKKMKQAFELNYNNGASRHYIGTPLKFGGPLQCGWEIP